MNITMLVDFICEIYWQAKWKYNDILQNKFESNISTDGDISNKNLIS